MTRAILPLVLAALLGAGCIELPEDASGATAPDATSRAGGSMSAEETRREEVLPCSVIGLEPTQRFCATRTITVTGTVSGIPLLDVELDTFNGDLTILGEGDGTWKLVTVLQARGPTDAAARAAIDGIDFAWAHEDAQGHFLRAVAHHEEASRQGEAAAMELRIPRALMIRLIADTSNGDVTLKGIRTDGLAADTSNGDIAVDADVTQVSLDTSNGDVEGTLRPLSGGTWSVDTSNGRIALSVPEGAAFGYDIRASTSNGDVEFGLRDGTKSACPADEEDCDERSFTTSRFSARQRQVAATLDSSNGDVTVSPR